MTHTPDQLAEARAIRARIDARYPRVHDDGRINASHVAAENTLRERAGIGGYIAELDGPGMFRPRLTPAELGLHAQAVVEEAVELLLDQGMTPADVGDALGVEQAWVDDLADDRDARLARAATVVRRCTGATGCGCDNHAP